MAQKAIITEEKINAGDIDANDIRCPRCKGTTLILKGNHQIVHEEILQDGVVVSSTNDPNTHAFELEIIECTPCSVRFLIKPREVYELEKMTWDMRQIILDLGGKDPFGLGRPS